jgi:signal transduction histidine kinase
LLRSPRAQRIGWITAIAAALAVSLVGGVAGATIQTATVASWVALLLGALAARAAARASEQRLRGTAAELIAVERELARTRDELEHQVAQRTAELSEANRQLVAEMMHRSQIEVDVRQAQKLDSVGQLASGIAHEINTPVQFVADSCTFLETATEDLLAVIAAHRAVLASLEQDPAALTEAASHARELEAERDVGYLSEQIPLAIARSLQGLTRVTAIVRAMKEFAHRDHVEQAPADLNRAIMSTLTVARNEYKYVAEVTTELADLPMVTCHVGELNQVFLNMVINSAHAIASARAERDRPGMIAIRTRSRGTDVEIEIEDNGCGIPPHELDKIFDPFFTTKEIGKGTGQGLAIARAVVDNHAGKIAVTSRVGYGTTFAITLPILGREGTGPSANALAS